MPPRLKLSELPETSLFCSKAVVEAAAKTVAAVLLANGVMALFPSDDEGPALPWKDEVIKRLDMSQVVSATLGFVGVYAYLGYRRMSDPKDAASASISILLQYIDQGLLDPQLKLTPKGRETLCKEINCPTQLASLEAHFEKFCRRHIKYFSELAIDTWPKSADDVDAAMVLVRRNARQLEADGSFTMKGLHNFRKNGGPELDKDAFEAAHRKIIADNPALFPAPVDVTPPSSVPASSLDHITSAQDVTALFDSIHNLPKRERKLFSLVVAAYQCGFKLELSDANYMMGLDGEATCKLIGELQKKGLVKGYQPANTTVAKFDNMPRMTAKFIDFSSAEKAKIQSKSTILFDKLPK